MAQWHSDIMEKLYLRYLSTCLLYTSRELVLSHAGRDRFFELLEGMTLEAEDVRGVRRELLVCRENPELIVTVRPEGRQGLKVSLDKKYSSFSGEKYLYVCDGQKLYLCQEEFGRDLRVFLEQMTQGYLSLIHISSCQCRKSAY